MGVVVDYVRKFDTRLQVELLRAYKPETLKTPGTNVNLGVKGDVFVLTEEQRHILMDYNRQWLRDHPPAPRELGRLATPVGRIRAKQRQRLATKMRQRIKRNSLGYLRLASVWRIYRRR